MSNMDKVNDIIARRGTIDKAIDDLADDLVSEINERLDMLNKLGVIVSESEDDYDFTLTSLAKCSSRYYVISTTVVK